MLALADPRKHSRSQAVAAWCLSGTSSITPDNFRSVGSCCPFGMPGVPHLQLQQNKVLSGVHGGEMGLLARFSGHPGQLLAGIPARRLAPALPVAV